MKNKIKAFFQIIEIQGFIIGIVSCLLGSIVFGIAIAVWESLFFIEGFFWDLFVDSSVFAFEFTVIPSGVVGAFLANLMKRDNKKGKLTIKKVVLRGATVSFILSLAFVSIFSEYLLYRRNILHFVITRSIATVIIATTACTLASYYLARKMLREYAISENSPT